MIEWKPTKVEFDAARCDYGLMINFGQQTLFCSYNEGWTVHNSIEELEQWLLSRS